MNTPSRTDSNELRSHRKQTDIDGNTDVDCGRTPDCESPENRAKRRDMTGKAVYSQDLFNEKIEAFIRKHRDEPFLPTLRGASQEAHHFVVFAGQLGPALVTADGWKVRFVNHRRLFQLFHLPDDQQEENNLADQTGKAA